ncbi:MAG: outer membrane protein transport protein [Deltaproteobacteria bacterium]|nr:outer membrane protein transport protein [Deltaproteobacteria bacterium]
MKIAERRRARTPALAVLAAFGVIAASASSARGTVPGLLGIGPRGVALGGAYVASTDDTYAIFYNPAGLASLTGPTVELGLFTIDPQLDPLKGGVVGEDADGEPIHGDVDPRVEKQVSAVGSIALPMTVLDTKVAGGALFVLPTDHAFTMTSRDAAEPGYTRYRHMLDLMYIYFGFGAELAPWLKAGAGMQMYYTTAGEIVFDLNLDGTPSQGELSLSAPWQFAPTAGVQLGPFLGGLTFGASYRGESRADFEDFHVTPGGSVGAGITYGFVVDIFNVNVFTPQQATLGLAWTPDESWRAELDVTWSNWAAYEDPTLIVRASGGVVIPPLPEVPIPIAETIALPYSTHDTWTPRVGVEYQLGDFTFGDGESVVRALPSLRAGFFWEASPIGDQSGVSNLVDNDRYVWSVGFGVDLPHPFGSDKTFGMNAAFQQSILAERTVRKDAEFADLDRDGTAETRVLGWPGYTSGGELIQFTIGFTLTL